LKAFSRLIQEIVERNDCVMEWMAVGAIHSEYLCPAGSILHIGDVVLGELLSQVQPNHLKLSWIAHVS
jgi:hypothetical protein